LGTGVEDLCISKDSRSIGINDELLARESGRGRGFINFLKHHSSFFLQKEGLGEETVDGCLSSEEAGQGATKPSLLSVAVKKTSGRSIGSVQGVPKVSLDLVSGEKTSAGADRCLRGAEGGVSCVDTTEGDVQKEGIFIKNGVEETSCAGCRAWKEKRGNLRVTLGRDMGMEEAGCLSVRGLVGRFGYGALGARDIHDWVEES
jgi:hypothetical protein